MHNIRLSTNRRDNTGPDQLESGSSFLRFGWIFQIHKAGFFIRSSDLSTDFHGASLVLLQPFGVLPLLVLNLQKNPLHILTEFGGAEDSSLIYFRNLFL